MARSGPTPLDEGFSRAARDAAAASLARSVMVAPVVPQEIAATQISRSPESIEPVVCGRRPN